MFVFTYILWVLVLCFYVIPECVSASICVSFAFYFILFFFPVCLLVLYYFSFFFFFFQLPASTEKKSVDLYEFKGCGRSWRKGN